MSTKRAPIEYPDPIIAAYLERVLPLAEAWEKKDAIMRRTRYPLWIRLLAGPLNLFNPWRWVFAILAPRLIELDQRIILQECTDESAREAYAAFWRAVDERASTTAMRFRLYHGLSILRSRNRQTDAYGRYGSSVGRYLTAPALGWYPPPPGDASPDSPEAEHPLAG